MSSSNKDMEFFQRPDWRITKLLLSSFGAWPFQSPIVKKILSGFVIFLLGSIVLPEICRLMTVWGDLNNVIDCTPLLILHILSIANMFNCLSNQKNIKSLLAQVRKDWQDSQSSSDLGILEKCGRKNTILTHVYIYYIYATTLSYLTTPLLPKIFDYVAPLNETRRPLLLYQTEYFVDPNKYGTWMMIHAYIISPFPSTIVVAYDALYSNCAQHACSMFVIIGKRMQNLEGNMQKCRHLHQKNKRLKYSLEACVKKHLEVLEFSHLLQSTYDHGLFLVLGINTLALTITGFQTVIKLHIPSEAMRFGLFTLSQIAHLFFICLPGQKLMDHSRNIGDSVYDGNWYDIPVKTRKLLILIIARSNSKPCLLTAGGLFVMSLLSFSMVVKSSMSYFTVLTSMQ